MRIVGLLQVRNELETGHLQRFIALNFPILDQVYVFDDSSTDGSADALEGAGAKVIRGEVRSFGRELLSKNAMLREIELSEPEGTWILRLDADEVCYASRAELHDLCEAAEADGFDSIVLGHLNLWKSEDSARVDDNFDAFRPVRLWKSKPSVRFPHSTGLHVTSDPDGLKSSMFCNDFPIFHYGFATEDLVQEKVANYWNFGQRGYPLNRLLVDQNKILNKVWNLYPRLGSRWKLNSDSRLPPSPSQLETMIRFNEGLVVQAVKRQSPKVTLLSLIFSDVNWLEFQYAELLALSREFPRGDVEILFVANDPTPEVEAFLRENLIPHLIFNGRVSPSEWYINSVYRAYNFGVQEAQASQVLLVNSDMVYCRDFLFRILEKSEENSFVTARLVESGRLESGLHGIEKDFGSSPKNFRRREFDQFVLKLAKDELLEGGLYMPLLVHKSTFLRLGGFPEGNLTPESLPLYLSGGLPDYAQRGQPSVPGDRAFFERARLDGIVHRTTSNAIAYHFQEGELKSSSGRKKRPRYKSGFWIVNDSLVGVNGETVFWSRLFDRLETSGARVTALEAGRSRSRFWDIALPFVLIGKAFLTSHNLGSPRVVFQNATYIPPIPLGISRISLLQDIPNALHVRLLQRLVTRSSGLVVTNSLEAFVDVIGKGMRWLPLPLDSFWAPMDRRRMPPRDANKVRAIFVGAFNETKGWDSLREVVLSSPSIEWTLVSKYQADPAFLDSNVPPNVRIIRKLSQEELRDEFRNNDVIVSSSPIETQHLASLEALSQGLAVVTTPTGYLGSFGVGHRPFGVVSDRITEADILTAAKIKFSPVEMLKKVGMDEQSIWKLWDSVMAEQIEGTFVRVGQPGKLRGFVLRVKSALNDLYRRYSRRTKYQIILLLKKIHART